MPALYFAGTLHARNVRRFPTRRSSDLSWDATARVLTVNGTVFIDGSAKVANGLVNSYKGVGSLYLSGTLLLKGSKLRSEEHTSELQSPDQLVYRLLLENKQPHRHPTRN